MVVLGCALGLLNVFIKLSEYVLEALRTRSESFMNKLFIYRGDYKLSVFRINGIL